MPVAAERESRGREDGFAARQSYRLVQGDSESLPDIIRECDYRSAAVRAKELAILNQSEQFTEVRKQMSWVKKDSYLVEPSQLRTYAGFQF
jgi:hypothetical protein